MCVCVHASTATLTEVRGQHLGVSALLSCQVVRPASYVTDASALENKTYLWTSGWDLNLASVLCYWDASIAYFV